jgi:hypothetical protein
MSSTIGNYIINKFKVDVYKCRGYHLETYNRSRGFYLTDNIDSKYTQYQLENLYVECYDNLFNHNKMETLSKCKEIQDLQREMLNWLIFECREDPEFCALSTKESTLETTEGLDEVIRQSGIAFQKDLDRLKEAIKTAMNLDNRFKYWR